MGTFQPGDPEFRKVVDKEQNCLLSLGATSVGRILCPSFLVATRSAFKQRDPFQRLSGSVIPFQTWSFRDVSLGTVNV